MTSKKSQGYRGSFIRVKTAKGRKPSSTQWLQRQLNDQYVMKSKIDGYESRAAYKLLEINDKYKIFKRGMNVVDLGAAPGGWSQVAAKLIQSDSGKNLLIALDLLPMKSLPGVCSIEGDFHDSQIKENLREKLMGQPVHVVMSDMAANSTGHSQTDHLRIMALCESAYDFAMEVLAPGGSFVAKIFRGGAENELLEQVKKNFTTVKHFKPKSSRKESSEFYLIATGKKLFNDV